MHDNSTQVRLSAVDFLSSGLLNVSEKKLKNAPALPTSYLGIYEADQERFCHRNNALQVFYSTPTTTLHSNYSTLAATTLLLLGLVVWQHGIDEKCFKIYAGLCHLAADGWYTLSPDQLPIFLDSKRCC